MGVPETAKPLVGAQLLAAVNKPQAVVCRVCDRPWGCGSYPGWGEAWHRHRRRFSPGVLIIDLGSRWRTIRRNRQNGF